MFGDLFQKITRRKVQIVLGVLWLIDGLFQFQPKMFTSAFANQVIAPVAVGQPVFVAGPVHFVVRIILHHPAIFNLCFGLLQLGLGILILNRRTVRIGLIASIVWGLLVWYFGEGLGGLATGQALLLMGGPGAALLYSVIAVGVMPTKSKDGQNRKPASWLVFAWALLWVGGANLQLLKGHDTTASLATMITTMASGAPHWLAALDLHIARSLSGVGNGLVIVLVGLQLSIGLLALLKRRWRIIAVAAGICLSLVFWVVGQGLGGFYSGLATDVNTGPLVILLGYALLGI